MAAKRDRPLQASRDQKPMSRLLKAVTTLRREVMDEVAIPGKYQMYFKPDKRALRKAESASATMPLDRSRPSKKVIAAKWKDSQTTDLEDDTPADIATDLQQQSKASSKRGFENVAWRALEQVYARNVIPHPYLHRDYLEILDTEE
ncbi:hypothetical protein BGZ65_006858 [Modicella reniformis]|uniref:Uncharacterized protein n=1 Tax=Modicella reniformis TaxID=1440133 RepID=A0A9P6LSA7_9FUNG|nr:hypothetical protein BGZ65_006858 [Modicella reniformis]